MIEQYSYHTVWSLRDGSRVVRIVVPARLTLDFSGAAWCGSYRKGKWR